MAYGTFPLVSMAFIAFDRCWTSVRNVRVMLARKLNVLSTSFDTVVVSMCSIVVNIFLRGLLGTLSSILFYLSPGRDDY